MSKLIDYISFGSSYLPLIFGLFLFKKHSRDIRLFIYYFSFTAFTDLAVLVTGVNGMNNLIILNFYSLLETYFLLYLFNLCTENKSYKVALKIVAILFTFVWVWINLFENSLYTFNPIDKGIKCLLFIILTVWLLNILSKNIQIQLNKDYRFWFLIAFLLYFSMTFIIYSTATWYINDIQNEAMRYTWYFHSIVTIITNLILTYGIICFYQNRNLYSSLP